MSGPHAFYIYINLIIAGSDWDEIYLKMTRKSLFNFGKSMCCAFVVLCLSFIAFPAFSQGFVSDLSKSAVFNGKYYVKPEISQEDFEKFFTFEVNGKTKKIIKAKDYDYETYKNKICSTLFTVRFPQSGKVLGLYSSSDTVYYYSMKDNRWNERLFDYTGLKDFTEYSFNSCDYWRFTDRLLTNESEELFDNADGKYTRISISSDYIDGKCIFTITDALNSISGDFEEIKNLAKTSTISTAERNRRLAVISDTIKAREKRKQEQLAIEREQEEIKRHGGDFPFDFGIILCKTNGGISHGYASLNLNATSSYGVGQKSVSIQDGTILLISGKQVWKKESRYTYDKPETQEYYEVYWGGYKFYIKSSDVVLLDEAKERLDTLLSCTAQTQEKFKEYTLELSSYATLREIEKVRGIYNSYKKNPIGISEWSWGEENDYTSYQDFWFTISNYSRKTIKYISFTVSGYNSVGDGVGSKTVRGIGPIETDETANYHFEDVIYSRIMSRARINSIKIQYMDGSIKTLTGNAITNCIWSSADKEYVSNFNKMLEEFEEWEKK